MHHHNSLTIRAAESELGLSGHHTQRQKLGTFTMKPSMRKDDEKTSPATPSSLKLGLLKCIYTFLFTRTRMHFMQQNVYIHFLSRTRNCVFINTYTKHLYNQSKDPNYLRRAIDGSDLSLNMFQWPSRKNRLLQSFPGIRPTFRGILFLQQIQRTSSTSLSPQPIETIIITQVRSQPMTERHRSFWCVHSYQLR